MTSLSSRSVKGVHEFAGLVIEGVDDFVGLGVIVVDKGEVVLVRIDLMEDSTDREAVKAIDEFFAFFLRFHFSFLLFLLNVFVSVRGNSTEKNILNLSTVIVSESDFYFISWHT